MSDKPDLILKPELKTSIGLVLDSNNNLIITAKDEVKGQSPQLVEIRNILQRALNDIEAQLMATICMNVMDSYGKKKLLMPGFRPTSFKEIMEKQNATLYSNKKI